MQEEERIDAQEDGRKWFGAIEDWRKAEELELTVCSALFALVALGMAAALLFAAGGAR